MVGRGGGGFKKDITALPSKLVASNTRAIFHFPETLHFFFS